MGLGEGRKEGIHEKTSRLENTRKNGSKASVFQLAWECTAARLWQQSLTLSQNLPLCSRKIFDPRFLYNEQERC